MQSEITKLSSSKECIAKLEEMKTIIEKHKGSNFEDESTAPCCLHGKNCSCKLYDIKKSVEAKLKRSQKVTTRFCQSPSDDEVPQYHTHDPKAKALGVTYWEPYEENVITLMVAGTICKDYSRLNQTRLHEYGL